MPFCPKCKNEYREGFTVCAECKCELVNSLEECEEQKEEASEIPKEVLREIMQNAVLASEEKEAQQNVSSGVYQNSAAKAEDNRTSAWTLLTVGVFGILFLVLVMTGVIPLYFYGVTKYLMFGVMSAMFLIFIVLGVVSLRNSKIFAKKAESESTLSDTMKEWCMANLKADELDAQLFDGKEEEMTSEMKYFRRSAEMKRLLSDKFLNLDEDFLDDFTDHIYEEVFKE